MDETWIKYDGKGMPVPSHALVEIMTQRELQMGHVSEIREAGNWDWRTEFDDGDIVAYRVISL